MKKIALFAAVSSFALALAACGDSGDASEDASANNVEPAADQAMSNVPDPVADLESKDEGQSTEVTQEQAESAADDAEAAVADAEAAAADTPAAEPSN